MEHGYIYNEPTEREVSEAESLLRNFEEMKNLVQVSIRKFALENFCDADESSLINSDQYIDDAFHKDLVRAHKTIKYGA